MILFSRFYSELHSLGTMFVDVNSTAAATVSDACTVFDGVGFKAECSILSGTDTPRREKEYCPCIDLDCIFAYIFSVMKG